LFSHQVACSFATEMAGIGALPPLTGRASRGRSCPQCMDRLLFASEDVRSEVADMYPACCSARGPWPWWE